MNTDLEKILTPLIPVLENLLKELNQKERLRSVQEQNEAEFRAANRALREKQEASIKIMQEDCPHIAGSSCLSEASDFAGRTSIFWHRLDTGKEVGLCSNCGRRFDEGDPDFWTWRRKPSFNKPSAAGPRTGSFIEDEDADIVVPRTQDELYILAEKAPAEGLESLNDADIKFLLEGVRQYRADLKDSEKALGRIYSGPEWSVG